MLSAVATPRPALAGDTCDRQPDAISGAGSIAGTPGNDVILGSDRRDVIVGNGGDDTV